MASGTAGSTPASAPAGAGRAAPYDGYIQKQLDKTRARVKLIDLAVSLLVLAISVLAYLLAVAIVDHWVMGLGLVGRLIALAGLVAGIAYYSFAQLLPLVIHRINPAYAARVIERSEPSLKNSLINFLMFRPDRATAPSIVYQALQQKAASDLSHVEIDSVIDRTKAMRLGYVLVAVFAICAIYSAASPKSTWQTIQRVAFPLSDIARPSRVIIEQIQPGDAEVFLGDAAAISAQVRGIGERDRVRLVYSTADGQIVDRETNMLLSGGLDRFEAVLPEDSPDATGAASHSSGLQQDVTYRIVAGDAISPQYRLQVRPAPTMFVERIEYAFPAYTGTAPQIQERQGDIKALEGTRITVHARANYPIQSASVEFRRGSAAAGSAPMSFDGASAKAEFVLQLNQERSGPRYTAYELRFVTADGRANNTPTLHRVEVLRDRDPTVEILNPKLARSQLPEDRTQPVEVRAVDPDFALSSVALVGGVAGAASLSEELLAPMSDGIGQQVLRCEIDPKKLGLVAGDVLSFKAVAKDNRTSPTSKSLEPNVVETRTYEIEIVPGATPADNEEKQSDEAQPSQEPQPGEQSNSRPQINPEQEPSPERDASQRQQQDGQAGQQQEGQNGQNGQSGAAGGEGAPPADQQKSQGQQGGGGQADGAPSDPGEQSADANAQGANGAGGQRNEGAQPGQRRQAGENGGQSPSGGNSGDPSQADQKRKLHDGEVFERTLEHIQKEQQAREQQASENKNQAAGQQDAQPRNQPAGAAAQNDASPQRGAQQNGGDQSNQAGGAQKGEQPGQSPMPQDGQTPGDGQSGAQRDSDQQKAQSGDGGKQGDGAAKSPQAADGNDSAAGANDRNQPPKGSQGAQQGAAQDDSGGKAGQPSEKPEIGDDGKQTPGAAERQGNQGDGPSEADQNAGAQKNGAPGDGESPQKNGAEPDRGDKPPAQDGGQSPQKDPGSGGAGDSGAGSASKDDKGSPGSAGKNADRQKIIQPDSSKPEDTEEAQSPSNSKRQSDSKGGQGGDESGGGKQGGGQGANQQGNDSAGSNSSSDDGAGASSETGEGDASTQGGDQQRAKSPTGQSGNEKGNGSSSSSDSQGGQSGGAAGGQSSQSASGEQGEDGGGASGGGQPRGGAPGGGAAAAASGPTGEVPDGDAANLDYAKNATDLVLEHLKDQQDNPDRELLESLNMTPEELRQFVQRWEQWKRAAAASDGEQSRELDEALRSLGLRPGQRQTRRDAGRNDSLRNLRDDSTGEIPLPGYRDLYRDYKKGAARAGSGN